VAILATLATFNLQLADLIIQETERIPPLRFPVYGEFVFMQPLVFGITATVLLPKIGFEIEALGFRRFDRSLSLQ